jgi:hypothetical protein
VIPKPEKSTKCTQNVPNGHKLSQVSLKYSKWPSNILTISNLRPYKIFPNWDFWFENKPSGNPAATLVRSDFRRIASSCAVHYIMCDGGRDYLCIPSSRVARFFLVHDSQTGKMYQIVIKYPKWT